jgi:hypothetical protein
MIDAVRSGAARRHAGRTTYLNHIHRDDAAGTLAHLMDCADLADLYLATDDEPVERSVALAWIASRLGVPLPPPADSVTGAEGRGSNRRYRNARLRGTGLFLKYPTFREGYGSLIADPRGDWP